MTNKQSFFSFLVFVLLWAAGCGVQESNTQRQQFSLVDSSGAASLDTASIPQISSIKAPAGIENSRSNQSGSQKELRLEELLRFPLDIRAETPVDAYVEPPSDILVLSEGKVAFLHRARLHIVHTLDSIITQIDMPCGIEGGFICRFGQDSLLVSYGRSLLGVSGTGEVFYENCDVAAAVYEVTANAAGLAFVWAHQTSGQIDASTKKIRQESDYFVAMLDFNKQTEVNLQVFRREARDYARFADLDAGINDLVYLRGKEVIFQPFDSGSKYSVSLPLEQDKFDLSLRLLGRIGDVMILYLDDYLKGSLSILAFNPLNGELQGFAPKIDPSVNQLTDLPNFAFMEEWPGGLIWGLDAPLKKLYCLCFSEQGGAIILSADIPGL